MSDNNRSSGGGIGWAGAVFLIFLTLKLAGVEPVASWSWLWVTSPLWIGLVVVLAIFTFTILSIGTTTLLGKLFAGRKVKLEDEDTTD